MIEEKRVYYPGMFDLLKGITIIGIIMTHISDLFPDELFNYTSPFDATHPKCDQKL